MAFSKFAYAGLREGATFEADAAFVSAIKAESTLDAYVGNAITIKDGKASLGVSGDPCCGVVEAVEPLDNRMEAYVVTVGFAKSYEGVPTGTTAPASGGGVMVDGTGKVIAVPVDSTKPVLAYAWIVDATAKTAIVKVL